MIADMTKEEVVARIDDWEQRLEALYKQALGFAKACGCPDDQVLRGEILQNLEEPMAQLQVPPRMLPTIAFLNGIKRVSLVPSAIWMREAKGRVNVSTNRHQYILRDVRESEDAPSHWVIATSRAAEPQAFSESIFRQLLEKQEFR
jgi:hypothetical protein